MPLRLVAAALALVLGISLAAAFRSGKPKRVVASASSAEVQEEEPREVSPLVARAEEGDPTAVAKLEALVEHDPDAMSWMAIGKGRIKLGDATRGIEALQKAVREDGDLAKDHAILSAVRRAADDDKARKMAMDFAEDSLGQGGADVLFDIWASTTEKTQATQLAKTYLDRDDVRKNASPALRVALDLRKGTNRCEEAKRLVATAKDVGDERAFRPLNQLNARKGCGFLGLADCFPCLRGEDALAEALKATQNKKGPRF